MYNISFNQVNALLKLQKYKCAVCKNKISNHKKTRATSRVDHDHKTGKIRGILCHRCNLFIGYIEKSPSDIIKKINTYINGKIRFG